MYSISPGSSTTSTYGTWLKPGKCSSSTLCRSTWLVLVCMPDGWGYSRGVWCGSYRRTYFRPTTCKAQQGILSAAHTAAHTATACWSLGAWWPDCHDYSPCLPPHIDMVDIIHAHACIQETLPPKHAPPAAASQWQHNRHCLMGTGTRPPSQTLLFPAVWGMCRSTAQLTATTRYLR